MAVSKSQAGADAGGQAEASRDPSPDAAGTQARLLERCAEAMEQTARVAGSIEAAVAAGAGGPDAATAAGRLEEAAKRVEAAAERAERAAESARGAEAPDVTGLAGRLDDISRAVDVMQRDVRRLSATRGDRADGALLARLDAIDAKLDAIAGRRPSGRELARQDGPSGPAGAPKADEPRPAEVEPDEAARVRKAGEDARRQLAEAGAVVIRKVEEAGRRAGGVDTMALVAVGVALVALMLVVMRIAGAI